MVSCGDCLEALVLDTAEVSGRGILRRPPCSSPLPRSLVTRPRGATLGPGRGGSGGSRPGGFRPGGAGTAGLG